MQQLYTIIFDVTMGKGQSEDVELLMDVCDVIKLSEGCGIAGRAAELIAASIGLFTDEWNGHIRRKRCAAGVCEGCSAAPAVPERTDGMRRKKRKSSE
jgi:hypothetical protein